MLLPLMLLAVPAAASAPIDRRAVVSRHSVSVTAPTAAALDAFDAFTLGNGAFAMNVDATGLQTFPQVVSKFSLNTLSDWQFHSTPSSATTNCVGPLREGSTATPSCGGANNTITGVIFASYGSPGGACGSFTRDPTCDLPNATATIAAACVGRPACSIPATNKFFGADPCLGRVKALAVQLRCARPPPPPSRAAALDSFQYTWLDTPVSNAATVPRPFATDNNISGYDQA